MFIVSIRVQPTRGDTPACGLGEERNNSSQLRRNMLRNGIQGLEPGHILRNNVRNQKWSWDLAGGM